MIFLSNMWVDGKKKIMSLYCEKKIFFRSSLHSEQRNQQPYPSQSFLYKITSVSPWPKTGPGYSHSVNKYLDEAVLQSQDVNSEINFFFFFLQLDK